MNIDLFLSSTEDLDVVVECLRDALYALKDSCQCGEVDYKCGAVCPACMCLEEIEEKVKQHTASQSR